LREKERERERDTKIEEGKKIENNKRETRLSGR
jgi:hypothetical protein